MAELTLRMIEAFCARNGMSLTAFGQAVAGDRHLVRRLRVERSMTLRRLDKVLAYIRAHDPACEAVLSQGVAARDRDRNA